MPPMSGTSRRNLGGSPGPEREFGDDFMSVGAPGPNPTAGVPTCPANLMSGTSGRFNPPGGTPDSRQPMGGGMFSQQARPGYDHGPRCASLYGSGSYLSGVQNQRLQRELNVTVAACAGNRSTRATRFSVKDRRSSRWSGWALSHGSDKGRKSALIASLRMRSDKKAAGELSSRSSRFRLSSGVASYRSALHSSKQSPAASRGAPDKVSLSFKSNRSFDQLHRTAAQVKRDPRITFIH